MRSKIISAIAAICLLISCVSFPSCQKKYEKYSEYSFDYFDTVTEITGYAKSKAEFDAVAADVIAQLAEYHRLFTIYHRFEGLENLCTINNDLQNGEHRTVKVDEKVIDMLSYAKEMHTLTGGMTNIAMGSVLSIWHDYRESGRSDPATAKLPPMDKLIAAAQHTDIDRLVIDKESCTVTMTDPKMTLDVGAIAKGYSVEMVAQSLESKGITGYFLNVGGNVRAIGAKPDGSGWKVGVENPLDGEAYIAYLSLTDRALVTSGSYQRYYLVDGQRYHHIIHPDTLMPSEGFISVSVLSPHSGSGDALSTALFCMSLEDGKALVASLPDVEALWLLPDGTVHTSDGWESYTTS